MTLLNLIQMGVELQQEPERSLLAFDRDNRDFGLEGRAEIMAQTVFFLLAASCRC